MKLNHFLIALTLLISSVSAFSQDNSSNNTAATFPERKLTIEPAIGIHPYPISDLVISNVLQWNIKKRLSLVSYTAGSVNSSTFAKFNFIKTEYNYSLTQKVGVGTSLFTKHNTHTFSLLGGIKYDAFKETLENPQFESVTASVSSVSPDFGFLYSLKMGRKNCFFTYRMYIPLYPYPVKTSDINAMDGNMANLSLEFGVGFKLN